MYLLRTKGPTRTLSGREVPRAALLEAKPAGGYAVLGNGWSTWPQFPPRSAIHNHMTDGGEATILRSAGTLGDVSLWTPAFTAVSSRRVAKAVDPEDARDLAILIEKEGRRLFGQSQELLGPFYKSVFGKLNEHWVGLPESHREAMLGGVLRNMESGFPEDELRSVMNPGIEKRATSFVKSSSKSYAKKNKLPSPLRWGKQDSEAAKLMAGTSTNYVRNLSGNISGKTSKLARSIVSAGFNKGLSNEEIADQLQSELSGMVGRTSTNYWRTVSSTYMTRARSWSQLRTLQTAGLREYEVVAVLDEVTTPVCRFLHGKRFRVQEGLDLFKKMDKLRTPGDIKYVQPWIRTSQDRDTGLHTLSVMKKSGKRELLAQETESGYGKVGATGAWDLLASGDVSSMAALNIGPPPYHGGCRSTTKAVLTSTGRPPPVPKPKPKPTPPLPKPPKPAPVQPAPQPAPFPEPPPSGLPAGQEASWKLKAPGNASAQQMEKYVGKRLALESDQFDAELSKQMKKMKVSDVGEVSRQDFKKVAHSFVKKSAHDGRYRQSWTNKPKLSNELPKIEQKLASGVLRDMNDLYHPSERMLYKQKFVEFRPYAPSGWEDEVYGFHNSIRGRDIIAFRRIKDVKFGAPKMQLRKVISHELGHAIEDQDPVVKQMRDVIVQRRIKGVKPRISGKAKYYDDKWIRPYAGAEYKGHKVGVEFTSVAMEYFFEEPKRLYMLDREAFNFCLAILRGI